MKCELLESSDELNGIFKQFLLEIVAPIFVVQNNTFAYVNTQFAKFLGYAKKELLSKSLLDFIHPGDRENVRKCLDTVGEEEESHRIRILSNSGEKWVNLRVRKVNYGGKSAVLGIVQDVDEIIRDRDELTEQRDKARALHSLLRHDLKNALSAALMGIELMKEGAGSLETVESSIRKALELIEHSKIEDLKPVDVARLAEKASQNIAASVSIKGNCVILADDSLYSVFHNIFDNAVRHGKATKIDVTIERKGRNCEVRISDNGIGIPDEQKEKIFQGCSWVKREGTGLRTVREVVRRLNGEVWIEDSPSGGATFVLLFRDRVLD